MSNAHKPTSIQIDLSLSRLDTNGRLQLIALIAQFAPKSDVYASNAVVKQATDTLIDSGANLDAANKDAEAKKQAYLAAIATRDAVEQQFDADATVLKASAEKVCKTEQDVQSIGFSRRPPRGASVPLVPPTDITAKPGNEAGSILVHAARIPGLYKYVAEISVDPMAPGSFQSLPGTTARRTLTGYESGKQYWIRYATERGTARSAWSEPVPVVAR